MSKWLTTGVCVLLPLAIFAGTIDHSISLSASDIKTGMVNGYDYVNIAGYDHLSTSGHPVLPVKYVSFVIPPDAQFERLELISEDGGYLPGHFTIFPGQEPVPISLSQGSEFTVPDEAVYTLNELYPSTAVKYVHEGNLAGYRIVSVLVTPLRYNPAIKRLYLANHIAFRIHYRSGAVTVRAITEARKRVAQERVRQIVANGEQVDVFAPPSPARTGGWQSLYIIITDPSFVDAFEPLREWKTKKGVPTEIVTTSDIYANYTGIDNPEKIRNFIREAADSGALYFLLAGQCDWENGEEYVPRRDALAFSYSHSENDTIPCDVYYSDLDGTWDADGDGTYGEAEDNVDMYSNVYVGRAPVKDVVQIENFVSKVIAYETAPSLSFVEKILLPVGNLWSGNHGNGINDTIADAIPSDWQKSKLYWDYGLLRRYTIRDSLDQGFHLAHMVGHGNEEGIYYYGAPYYHHTDPGTQTNDSTDAIIANSMGCMCGAVDYGGASADYDCLAERMVNTNKRCATATIMNTRYGWGYTSPEGNIGLSGEFSVWFYRMLFNTDAYHLGEALAAAKDQLVPKASPESPDSKYYRWCLYTYTLFGDPEMPLWTDMPDTMQVTYDAVVPVGSFTFDVTVADDNGVSIENARVCLMCKQDTLYHVGYTNTSGTASFLIEPMIAGDTLWVTVTAANRIPHAGSVLIIPTSGPYVAMSSKILDDADGNGQANPGEVIELGVWARNWGNQAAVKVNGYLLESDPYTSVSISESKYGRIPADDSSLSRPYYRFTVAGSCPNKHVIAFDLEFEDRDHNTWTSHPKVTVYAPILTVEAVSVVNDDNEDGVLGPDETADVVVTLENEGDATATNTFALLTTDSPYITVTKPFSSFGTIAAGAFADNAEDPFDIIVDDATPYNTEIDFSVIVQAGAYRDTLDFILMVYPPIVTLLDVSVVNDDDGDGALEPGETGDVVVTLTNEGNATANKFLSVLITGSSFVTLNDSVSIFAPIVSGDTADNAADPYTITADSATPYLSEGAFSIFIQSDVYADTLDFTLNLGKFPPSDTGLYYAYYSGGPHAYSPVFEWIAIDSTQTEYPGISLDLDDDHPTAMLDLPFSFNYYGIATDYLGVCVHGWVRMGGPVIRNFPDNSGIPVRAGPRAMVAGIWDHLEAGNPGEPSDIYYYYDEPNHRFIVEFFRVEHDEGGDYETFEIILYDPAYYQTPTGHGEIVVQYLTAPQQTDITIGIENQAQMVGIQYYYDGMYHDMAAAITDSFAIKYSTCSSYPGESGAGAQARTESPGSAPIQTFMAALHPNPFKQMTVIRYQIADAAQTDDVSLEIFDITGRLVKQFNHITIQPFNQVIWDGCDDVGRKVPAGVYFVQFESEGYKSVEKAVLLR